MTSPLWLNSNNVSWTSNSATSKLLPHSNGLSRAMISPLCSQSCNPLRPLLLPNQYVTVIPVQSTKAVFWLRPFFGCGSELAQDKLLDEAVGHVGGNVSSESRKHQPHAAIRIRIISIGDGTRGQIPPQA